METPWERWCRRQSEIQALREQAKTKEREIDDELEAARKVCSPHIDDGSMFEGHCIKCRIGLG